MDYDDAKKSKFNAGVAWAERIDAIQRAINAAKFNPFMRNVETGTYGYEVMTDCLNTLMSEGWDKFSEPDRIKLLRMDSVIRSLLKYYPPIVANGHGDIKIKKENYETFLNFFGRYERHMKDLYGKHNLNSPTMADDEGL